MQTGWDSNSRQPLRRGRRQPSLADIGPLIGQNQKRGGARFIQEHTSGLSSLLVWCRRKPEVKDSAFNIKDPPKKEGEKGGWCCFSISILGGWRNVLLKQIIARQDVTRMVSVFVLIRCCTVLYKFLFSHIATQQTWDQIVILVIQHIAAWRGEDMVRAGSCLRKLIQRSRGICIFFKPTLHSFLCL